MELLLALAACVFAVIAWRRASAAQVEVAALRALVLALQRGDGAEPTEDAAVQASPKAEPPPIPPWTLPPKPQPIQEAAFEAVEAAPPKKAFDVEELLTQRWGLWLGSVALLLAGVFLVRTAVEQGWLGPGARCAAAGLFGAGLVGGAEWLRRWRSGTGQMVDVASPALAAGGVGVLFAAAYGAGPLYGLVSATAGFILLGAAGTAGLALSLRFGWLVGAVGLAAAFVTPALVQSTDPSLPGLFSYLLFVSAASWAVVRLTGWVWLGWAAALGGAGWVASVALATAGGAGITGAWAPGLFVPAATALTLALLPGEALESPAGRPFSWAPLLLLGLAGLLLLSSTRDEAVRVGLLLLAPVTIAKAWTEPRLSWLPMLSAGLCIASVWVWGIDGLQTPLNVIRVEGVVQAVLPLGWTFEGMVWPFMGVPTLVASTYAVVGLVGERRRPAPLAWAALVAAVPVTVLAVAYAEVGRLHAPVAWAIAAGALACGLVGAAALARQQGAEVADRAGRARAGVHAAGAVAALALGCAIMLEDAWLSVALALLLPGLAWIEAAADLPPLRRVAMAAAAVVLARLAFNPWVLNYGFGGGPVLNGVLVAYGMPAAAFGAAAWMFRRRADDRLVAMLEAGAIAFLALLLTLEVRYSTQGALGADSTDFAELAWQASLLGALAAALQEYSRRTGRLVARVAFRVVGFVALAVGLLLLLANPFVWTDALGSSVIISALITAYLVPAGLAVLVMARGGGPRWLLGPYAFLAALMFASAQVRQAFHPGDTAVFAILQPAQPVVDAELWALSFAWLLLAAGQLAAGIALRQRPLRLAGLGMMALVAAKVFLIDMAGLEGLWRVLSFFGLGLTLISLGTLYQRFGQRLGRRSGQSVGEATDPAG